MILSIICVLPPTHFKNGFCICGFSNLLDLCLSLDFLSLDFLFLLAFPLVNCKVLDGLEVWIFDLFINVILFIFLSDENNQIFSDNGNTFYFQ